MRIVDLKRSRSKTLFFELVGQHSAVMFQSFRDVAVVLSDVILHSAQESAIFDAGSPRAHLFLVRIKPIERALHILDGRSNGFGLQDVGHLLCVLSFFVSRVHG